MLELLDKFLEYKSYQLPFFCFIEGYAGTGKTTFIHWYSQHSKIDMNHALIDLSGAKSDTHAKGDRFSGEDLFEDYFLKLWPKIYRKYTKEVEDFLTFLDKESDLLTSHFSKTFFSKLKKRFKKEIDPPINATQFTDFLNNIEYTEMIEIFMLMYNKYPKIITIISDNNAEDIKEDRELLLFFDNMDSMKMEAKSSIIPKKIASVYYSYYMAITSEFSEYFSVDRKINFVFCMRDSVFSIINPQHKDFIQNRYLHFGIAPGTSDKIYKKRVNFSIEKALIKDTLQYKLIDNAYKDTIYLNRSYLPLFNYNLRKLSYFLAYTSTSITEKDISLYEKLANHNNSRLRVGARGVYFFLIIKTMKSMDFISNNLITKEGQPTRSGGLGLLNISRIILTVIHNRTQYDLNLNSKIENLTEASLFDIYTSFSELFEGYIDDFVDTLSSLFLFYEHNWCHLITLKNISIFDKGSMDEIKDKLKLYEKHNAKNNIVEKIKIKQELAKIKVRINASGYIFLKDIIRHYEYHSVKAGNKKALFLCTGMDNLREDHYSYEFEKSLRNTKDFAFFCIGSLRSFLDGSNYPFEESLCCFRLYSYGEHSITQDGEYDHIECYENFRTGQLLLNRIIDTHTNYIDSFRIFLINDVGYIKEFCEKTGKTDKEIRFEINKKITGILKEYISKYYVKRDKRLFELKQLQMINLNKINNDATKDKYDLFLNFNRERTYMPI